jgi:release factor glutamine methyltransferase
MEAVLESKTAIWTQASCPLSMEKAVLFQSWLERRGQREPFHLIVGEVDFFGRPFILRPGVLIPRPETELVVTCCVQELRRIQGKKDAPVRILDLGAGSGAIVISILMELPDSLGIAVERESEALSVLIDNRARHGLEKRLAAVRGNWGKMLANKAGFDCIVSNPPYIPTPVIATLDPEVRNFEPMAALDGGIDGLEAYREILSFAPFLLNDHGILVFEIGADQANEKPFRPGKDEKETSGFLGDPKVLKDVLGRDRVLYWKKKE